MQVIPDSCSSARALCISGARSPGATEQEMSADQVTPHCRCEWIITSVLTDCTCSSPTQTKSVFERISASSSVELPKRLRFHDYDAPSDDEFPKVSANMVAKDTGKHPALEPENSATPSVYMGSRSRSGTIRHVNYKALEQ